MNEIRLRVCGIVLPLDFWTPRRLKHPKHGSQQLHLYDVCIQATTWPDPDLSGAGYMQPISVQCLWFCVKTQKFNNFFVYVPVLQELMHI